MHLHADLKHSCLSFHSPVHFITSHNVSFLQSFDSIQFSGLLKLCQQDLENIHSKSNPDQLRTREDVWLSHSVLQKSFKLLPSQSVLCQELRYI